jgi:hypothetical protein
MTTFKEIRGTDILALSSDPANPEIGQIWYNSSSGTLKGYQQVNAWSTGGNMGTGRYALAGFGTQTASLGAGGYAYPSPGGFPPSTVEVYNGTSWTSSAAYSRGNTYDMTGIGTQTAGLIAAGYQGNPVNDGVTTVEAWNGSSWTSSPSLNTLRWSGGSTGTQTAALILGGKKQPATIIANVESYNGTSWTSKTSLPAATSGIGAVGTNTAALVFGGQLAPYTTGLNTSDAYSFNGTSWTAVPGMSNIRGGGFGAGTQTLAQVAGGYNNTTRITAMENWNGTTWSSSPASLGFAQQSNLNSNGGTTSQAIAFGGLAAVGNPGTGSIATNRTQEWDSLLVKTITVS